MALDQSFLAASSFSATSCSKRKLDQFIEFLDSFHPALDFTWEISETSVTFLDIDVPVNDSGLATDLLSTTSRLIHTVTRCILPRIPLMSRTRSHNPSFFGSAAYAAIILISFRSPTRCANSLQKVVTPVLLSPVHSNVSATSTEKLP